MRTNTNILKRIPVIYDKPPNTQLELGWIPSEWHFASPDT